MDAALFPLRPSTADSTARSRAATISSHGRRGPDNETAPGDGLGESIESDLMAPSLASAPAVPPPKFARLAAVASGLLHSFFDRVIRQAFSDLVLDDTPAAGYLTELLTRFARAEALRAVQAVAERRLDTVVDSLLAIQGAWDLGSSGFNPSQEDALRRHIGDYTLFMTGIFRDHVERLAVTSYYQHEGRRAYRFVAETARTAAAPTPLSSAASPIASSNMRARSPTRARLLPGGRRESRRLARDPFRHVFAAE